MGPARAHRRAAGSTLYTHASARRYHGGGRGAGGAGGGGGGAEVAERRDVVLARFDFDPSEAAGDEYSLSIVLDLGDARARAANHPYSLGDSIPAFATVTCLCRPLRADSVRGSYTIQTRGLRQIAGRIDATLYFTAWNDPKTHATYRLRQRIHGVRP